MTRTARLAVLIASFAGLLFDGWELGLMPIASLSVTKSILGTGYTDALGGEWFARFTAGLMFGAAIGGIWLGNLGDQIGRVRAMGLSILFYSVFAGLGAFVDSLEQMLVLRFLSGLGVGGMWPNGVALVGECLPQTSRPLVSGIMGAGMNAGVLTLSQVARFHPITPDSWRWLFGWSAVPATLGVVVLLALPESPRWLASREFSSTQIKSPTAFRELFRPPLLRLTLIGIALGSIPLVGAWSASKWMIPWADKLGGTALPGYKALTQGWWALGSTLGSFFGAQIAGLLGRRLTYFLISLGAVTTTLVLFNFTAPLRATFLPMVFVQGFVATLFFGWLPLYLPELFPTRIRATGSGLSYNSGRFVTAVLVFAASALFVVFHGDYSKVGSVCALVYGLGMIVIFWAPDTTRKSLDDT
jgi:SHS family sialic acid transporter-like MFS transporter